MRPLLQQVAVVLPVVDTEPGNELLPQSVGLAGVGRQCLVGEQPVGERCRRGAVNIEVVGVGDLGYRVAVLHKFQYKQVVFAIGVARVETKVVLLDNLTSEQFVAGPFGGVVYLGIGKEEAPFAVGPGRAGAVEPVRLRSSRRLMEQRYACDDQVGWSREQVGEIGGGHTVVGIDKGDVFAPGLGQSPVAGRRYPGVALVKGHDTGLSGRISVDEGCRAVGRAVVDNQNFERRVVLVQHAVEAGRQKLLGIVDRYDDRDKRIHKPVGPWISRGTGPRQK